MIRKVVITLLTFAALATMLLWASLPPCPGIMFMWPYMRPYSRLRAVSRPRTVQWGTQWCGGGLHIRRDEWRLPRPRGLAEQRPLGAYYNTRVRAGCRITKAYIPLWIPFVLFSAYPTVALIYGPYRRHRRRKKHLCIKCGYNLRGNVSGICPECGERI